MPPQPPAFHTQAYWDQRFTSNPTPFEWLESPGALDPFIRKALHYCKSNFQILHIGCGTSALSAHLCGFVETPRQVHNVDYSDVAVDLGRKRDLESQRNVGTRRRSVADEEEDLMRWSRMDLLSSASLLETLETESYDLIIDKSTSDSISCADDMVVAVPYLIHTQSSEPCGMGDSGPQGEPLRTSNSRLFSTPKTEAIHPLNILATHLALVTKPGGAWIAVSYSKDRYPFLLSSSLQEPRTVDSSMRDPGFPDPALLWKLEEIEEIEVPQVDGKGEVAVNAPRVVHWVYVLRRTGVGVYCG